MSRPSYTVPTNILSSEPDALALFLKKSRTALRALSSGLASPDSVPSWKAKNRLAGPRGLTNVSGLPSRVARVPRCFLVVVMRSRPMPPSAATTAFRTWASGT